MSVSSAPSGDTARTRLVERGWFADAIELFESPLKGDRTAAIAEAEGIWLGYALYCERVECLTGATTDDKQNLRRDLDRAHYEATEFLLLEAERAGLNCAPLLEMARVCRELLGPIRLQGPISNTHGVEWFHHPNRTSDFWPDCLGEWRYALPQAMQEAIRQGAEVFTRLTVYLHTPAASHAAPPNGTQQGEGEKPKPEERSNRIPLAEAEILVRAWLLKHAKSNPAAITRDAVAEGTGVSTGQVSNTFAWKAFRERRDTEAKSNTRETSFTDQLEAVIPTGNVGKAQSAQKDPVLNELIRQQEADAAEESRRHERRHRPS